MQHFENPTSDGPPAGDFGAPPPSPASVGQPLLSGAYGAPPPAVAPPAPSGGGGRIAWIAAIGAALALLVGGGFFALGALGAQDGAASPEEAVDRLIEAVNNEDFITLGELMDPTERRTIAEPVISDVLPELVRLGVFDESLDAGAVDGLDFELTDVTYRVEPLVGHTDLMAVWFTSGSSSASFLVDEFPFGDAVRSRFGDEMIDEVGEPTEINTTAQTPMVLVERDGRWFVSMWFTIAEGSRIDSGLDLPVLSDMPASNGASSPEAAVEAMIDEMVEFDLEGMIGRLDPDEMAALYRYSPLFLEEVQDELDFARRELSASGARWDITDLAFDVDTNGDDAVVTIESLTFTIDADEIQLDATYSTTRIEANARVDFDGDVFEGTLLIEPTRLELSGSGGGETFDVEVVLDADGNAIRLEGNVSGESFRGELALDGTGSCSRFEFSGLDESIQGCLEEELGSDVTGTSVESMIGWIDQLGTEFPGFDIAARRTDGDWFVSPMGTVMHNAVKGLEGVEQGDFDDMLDQMAEASDAGVILDLIDPDGITSFGSDPFVIEEGTDGFARIDPVEPTSNSLDLQVDFGTTVTTGLLGPNEENAYVVELPNASLVGVTLYGADAVPGGIDDPVLRVVAPDGFEIAYNDDYDSLNSGLQFSAFEAGEYQIVVADLAQGTGSFQLTVEVQPEGADPATMIGYDDFRFPVDPGTGSGSGGSPSVTVPPASTAEDFSSLGLTSGGSVFMSGALSSSGFDLYEIELIAGETVTITLEADEGEGLFPLDTVLVLSGPDGFVVAENDDSSNVDLANPTDSEIIWTAQASGTYGIQVRSFGDFGEGPYVISAERN
ncbi:MAG: hypothetical protein ACR2P0_11985 [Acidimicrobiales bacterium]